MSRVLRHILFFLASAALVGAFHVALAPERVVWRISMATGYGGLVLLAWALAIGPWNTVRGRPNPVSSYLRRDVGIWAGVLSIVHVIAGLQAHFEGKMLMYFLRPPDAWYSFPLRIDPFGLANHAGLVATLIFVMLLFLSNNASLRALGPRRWKSLQRWNYIGSLLLIPHGVIYMVLERRTLGFVVVSAVIVLAAAAIQLAGFRARRAATA